MIGVLKISTVRMVAVVALVGLTGGCSMMTSRTAAPAAAATTPASTGSPAAAFIGSAPTGSAGMFTVPEYGGTVQLIPGEPYFAASGRTCRTFMARGPQGVVTPGVACQDKRGWRITPPITAGRLQ